MSTVARQGSKRAARAGSTARPKPAHGTDTVSWPTRIAAAVDGFPEGRDAAALGALIAAATDAELTLVNVHSPTMFPAPPNLRWKNLRRESLAALREVRDSIAPKARISAQTDSSVPRALHRMVERGHRDLLIVGSSRDAESGHTRIGKRTRQLLGHFDCPLGVARRGMATADSRPLRQIGVGYDGGPEATHALDLAALLAAATGAELRVLGGVDDRVPTLVRSAMTALVAVEWHDLMRVEVDELHRLIETAARRLPIPVRTQVTRGRPADALLELSEEVDLKLIGSRRWGPASRVLLGSTGEALLHDAACSVITVPRPAD